MKKENLLKIITFNEWAEGEATTRPDILHFFGQGNFIFIGEKSGMSVAATNKYSKL